MRSCWMVSLWAVLLASSASAGTADLTNIERRIQKEPDYRHAAPQYCLFVFGPEARLRMWGVLDDTDFYLDRNMDGDLTAADERFPDDAEQFAPFEIADSGKRYRITSVDVIRLPQAKGSKDRRLLLGLKVTLVGRFRQYSGAFPSRTVGEAPVSHFDGPLTVDFNRNEEGRNEQQLVRGEEQGELYAMIGTVDLKNGCWVAVENRERSATNGDAESEDLPESVVPVAVIEFPAQTPGDPPIKELFELKERC